MLHRFARFGSKSFKAYVSRKLKGLETTNYPGEVGTIEGFGDWEEVCYEFVEKGKDFDRDLRLVLTVRDYLLNPEITLHEKTDDPEEPYIGHACGKMEVDVMLKNIRNLYFNRMSRDAFYDIHKY